MINNADDVLVEWLHKRRQDAKVQMDDLTLLSGVSQGHISRIETGVSKLTINACVRLVYGLGIEFQELASFLDVPVLYPPQLEPRENHTLFINATDISAFLGYYRDERREAIDSLSNTYHRVQLAALERSPQSAYSWQDAAESIWRATEASSVELSALPYPQNLDVDYLIEMFVSGAIMTFRDAGVFIKKRRANKSLSLRDVAEKINVSHVSLTRLEQGRMSRAFLSTLIGVGKELQYLDALFGMVWAASEYDTNILFQRTADDGLYPSDDLQRNLADTLIMISRWYYALYPEDTDWIDKLRVLLSPYYR